MEALREIIATQFVVYDRQLQTSVVSASYAKHWDVSTLQQYITHLRSLVVCPIREFRSRHTNSTSERAVILEPRVFEDRKPLHWSHKFDCYRTFILGSTAYSATEIEPFDPRFNCILSNLRYTISNKILTIVQKYLETWEAYEKDQYLEYKVDKIYRLTQRETEDVIDFYIRMNKHALDIGGVLT